MKTFLLWLAGMLLPVAGQAAGPKLTLSGPESITSEREKPVELSLTITPGELAAGAQDIQVTANAGVVLGVKSTSGGTYQVSFRPPWVVSEMPVSLTASVRLGKQSLRAHRKILVLPAEIPIGQVVSAGPLEIRAPDRLIFERHESITLSFNKTHGKPPRLLASVGKLSELVATDDGRWQANYTPPEKQFPQVAIIAAYAGSAVLDWIAIPLYAQARVDTRTEPGASVDILIGDTIFGPLRAGRKGRANMDVLVPPGVPSGTTIATDQLGNTKKAALNLRVPAFRRILGLCPVDADRLRAIVVDARGKPALNARLEVSASLGRLLAPVMTAPGVYESLLSLPAAAPIGKSVELGVGIRGERASRTTCSTKIRGLPPTGLKVGLAAPRYTAGGPPLAVTVELLGQHGQPARMVSLDFTTSLGKISKVHTVSPGRYAATWTLPARLEGRQQARIRVSSRGQPAVASESTVELASDRIARIDLSADDSSLAADGRSTTTIQARAYDKYGNLVAPVKLNAVARGEIGRLSDQENSGTYRAVYTSPELIDPQADTIVVTEESTRLEASLRIELRESRPALTVGPRIGYGTNLGRISSFFFAADVAIRMPFYQDLSAGVEFGYYWSDTRDLSSGGEELVSTSVWVAPILARVAYALPLKPVVPYLGLAAGTAIVGREVSSPSTGRTASRKAHFALSGFLGAELGLGPGRVLAELAYLHVVSNETVVSGSTGGLVATVGYHLGF